MPTRTATRQSTYAGLLAAMGKSEAEIAAMLAALRREVGLYQM
jgi:hypothetical protein